LFKWNKQQYLMTTNYHSCYFKIDKLPCTTSGKIIQKLKAQFAYHGIWCSWWHQTMGSSYHHVKWKFSQNHREQSIRRQVPWTQGRTGL
jgi:hypothetical protein